MQTDRTTYRDAIGIALAAGIILLVPLLAMRLSEEVVWDAADFAVAWTLLFGAGLTYKLIVRRMGPAAYRAGAGVAVGTALLLVWVNLAVGLIGSEGNPANLMYGGVLAVGVIGALIARFQPRGMWRAMVATALAQGLAAVIALIAGLGSPGFGAAELAANGFFVALFVASAWLFRKAAREGPARGVA